MSRSWQSGTTKAGGRTVGMDQEQRKPFSRNLIVDSNPINRTVSHFLAPLQIETFERFEPFKLFKSFKQAGAASALLRRCAPWSESRSFPAARQRGWERAGSPPVRSARAGS